MHVLNYPLWAILLISLQKENGQNQITSMHALADRFIDADYYVFVTPIWNFGHRLF